MRDWETAHAFSSCMLRMRTMSSTSYPPCARKKAWRINGANKSIYQRESSRILAHMTTSRVPFANTSAFRSARKRLPPKTRATRGFLHFNCRCAGRTTTSCAMENEGKRHFNFRKTKPTIRPLQFVMAGLVRPPMLTVYAAAMDGRTGPAKTASWTPRHPTQCTKLRMGTCEHASACFAGRGRGCADFRENNHTRCRGAGAPGRNTAHHRSKPEGGGVRGSVKTKIKIVRYARKAVRDVEASANRVRAGAASRGRGLLARVRPNG